MIGTKRDGDWKTRQLIRSIFIVAGLMLEPACAMSRAETEMSREPIIARFPAEWTEKIHFAQQDFLTTGQELDCFELVMGWDEEGQYYYIAFFPERRSEEPGHIGATECGTGVSYHFDSCGKFLKRVFQR